ncbi:hypothetical protein F7725_013580 [Dissostichus mawsoni]|uniref:Uncharacterized protein n=1 Tax=Dissostichus mawsoni TaxID=36200 RepID=A0A7J5Y6A0_DISMA|nr:hypothetical protein F7725_013580 [Dissostichus mawsoni]
MVFTEEDQTSAERLRGGGGGGNFIPGYLAAPTYSITIDYIGFFLLCGGLFRHCSPSEGNPDGLIEDFKVCLLSVEDVKGGTPNISGLSWEGRGQKAKRNTAILSDNWNVGPPSALRPGSWLRPAARPPSVKRGPVCTAALHCVQEAPCYVEAELGRSPMLGVVVVVGVRSSLRMSTAAHRAQAGH